MSRNNHARRLLVIANEALGIDGLHDVLAESDSSAQVLVVAPVLSRRRVDYWTGDDRDARKDAVARLAVCVHRLRTSGFDVEGALGDADPVVAIEDALCEFPADAIVVVTHPPERSSWLERGVVERARARFPGVPVLRDLARPSEGTQGKARKIGRAPLKQAWVTVDKRPRGAA